MNLRRWITALAVLAVFTALASAQVVQPTPINCSVSASTNKAIRSEGLTELVGDVLLTCTGGPTPTDGNAADRATITVDFGVPVTSRQAATIANVGNPSEIMLLIDEPNVGGGPAGAFGQNAGISVCTANSTNNIAPAAIGDCPAFARPVNGYWVLSSVGAGAAAVTQNAYQATVGTSNTGGGTSKVTIANVPVIATGANNVQRVYRLVNVRVNPGSAGAITATVTVTPDAAAVTTLNLTNNTATAATPQASLTTSVTPIGGASLCASTAAAPVGPETRANMALLTFKENFTTAFRTRVLPLGADAAGLAQGGGATQNRATGNYTIGAPAVAISAAQSESGVIEGSITPGGVAAGLAASGTRLKANFRGLPPVAKAQIFVSLNNVADYQNEATAPALGAGDQSNISFATVIGVSGGVNQNGTETAGTAVPGTTVFNAALGVGPGVKAIPVVPNANGEAEVVWEVTNVQRDASDTFTFAVYAVYDNVNNVPALGANGTIQLGYAPSNSSNNQTHIPRFAALGSGNPQVGFFNVVPCQTTLLFPFVTNQAGFETGIAISNTSKDPFNTITSEGACSLNFYGANQPAAAITTASVPAGTSYANTASALGLANFSGYMVGVCNFQFAHGFAFVQDARGNMAMGYLALVMADTPNRAGNLVGEVLGQ